MAKSFTRKVFNGASDRIPVAFPYLDKSHVKVYLDGVLLETSKYTWPTSGEIQITAGNPASGVVGYAKRYTPETPITVFVPGNLDVTDLNVASLQPLFVAQEGRDLAEDTELRGWVTAALGVGGTITKGGAGEYAVFDEQGNIGAALGQLPANTVFVVASLAALKALVPSAGQVAYLNASGLEGAWKWTAGNFSSMVAADTASGMYAKANTVSAASGAWVRVGDTLLSHFGGSATSNSAAAVAAMAALLGYVVVGRGDHLIGTTSITVPVFFLEGGAFLANSGSTVTFSNRIISGKQQIFKGAGTFQSDIVNEIGEDAKNVHASWFGLFPVGATINSEILTTKWNKAFEWYGAETREGVFELDCGSYYIDGQVTVPRGVHLKGTGSRRTIIDVKGGGYTCFVAGGDAVKITGIHMEQHTYEQGQFDGTFIDLGYYNGCELEDIWVWGRTNGIIFGGNDIAIRRVTGRYNYGSAPVAGSSIIWQKAGQNARIEDVWLRGQTYAPTYMVRLGNGDDTDIIGTSIQGLYCGEASIPLRINASGTQNIRSVNVDGVHVANADANNPAVIDIQNSGSGLVENIMGSQLQSLYGSDNLLRIGQTGSGTTQFVTIVSGDIESSFAGLAALTRTNGVLSDVVIGAGVNGEASTAGVTKSGTMSNIRDFTKVKDGTYTPTVTGVTNIASVQTPSLCWWTRVGDVVTVSGYIPVTATAAGVAEFDISIPVPSNFTASTQAAGSARTNSSTAQQEGVIYSDLTDDGVTCRYVASSGAAHTFWVNFSYRVL